MRQDLQDAAFFGLIPASKAKTRTSLLVLYFIP
jgi:hypothetical protein